MTVKILKPKTNRKLTGLSTDLKPTLGIDDIGDEFYELDTKDKYEWFGDQWINTLRGGLPNDEHATYENHELLEGYYFSLTHHRKLPIQKIPAS